MYEAYKMAGVVLEINPDTNTVVRADFTFVTELARKFICDLIEGYDLASGIDKLISTIESHYFAPSSDAVITALRIAYQRYNQTAVPRYRSARNSIARD